MTSIPKDKNKLLLRFENLGSQETLVNVTGVAEAFNSAQIFEIMPMSLTGNMFLFEKYSREIHWKTDGYENPEWRLDDNMDSVKIEKLDIKVFQVTYGKGESFI